MATKFFGKNPGLKCSALMGSNVMQGLTRGQIAQEWHMATKFGRKNP